VLSKNIIKKIITLVFVLGLTGGIALGQANLPQNVQLSPLAVDGSINKRFAPAIGQKNSPLEMRILIVTAIEDDGNMVAMR